MLHGLDLFSGYGGITLGLQEWVKPIAYCEIEKYAQSILLSRMSEGKLPIAPIWDDIRTLETSDLGQIDIVYGGFPCQDISIAGRGAGLEGERSGLFFELCRVVKEINPYFIFIENVPAIRTRGLREIMRAFTDLGYDCRWTSIFASEVGAKHQRKRWFCLAYAKGNRLERLRNMGKQKSNIQGKKILFRCEGENSTYGQWKTEPNVGRVVNGCTFRVDRIKALGNGVVPIQVREAFVRLIGANII